MEGVKVTRAFAAGLVFPLLAFAAPMMVHDLHEALTADARALPYPESPDAFRPLPQRDVPEQLLDMYGNEVAPAISEYLTDGAGSLYELHAPQVEIPRLASPTS
jgi:hypothetical protein